MCDWVCLEWFPLCVLIFLLLFPLQFWETLTISRWIARPHPLPVHLPRTFPRPTPNLIEPEASCVRYRELLLRDSREVLCNKCCVAMRFCNRTYIAKRLCKRKRFKNSPQHDLCCKQNPHQDLCCKVYATWVLLQKKSATRPMLQKFLQYRRCCNF